MRRRADPLQRCLPHEEIERLDRELGRLGRGTGALPLRLGEALEALSKSGGHRELGFATLEAYALERCERGGRWALESAGMARRLADRPALRAALLAAEISWSMADLLSRHGSAAEDTGLLDKAKASTIRQMREHFRTAGAQVAESDDPEPRRKLTTTVPTEDAWAFEVIKKVARAVTGSASTDALVEGLLGEGLIALQNLAPRVADEDLPERETAAKLAAAWRAEAEIGAEDRVPRDVPPSDPLPDPPLPTTPLGLDAEIRRLSADLARRDLELGDVALRFFAADGWRRLHFASERQYVRERIGVSHASLKGRMTLARRARRVPGLADAVAAGRLRYEAASLVARVATPETAKDWLARAETRTLKHLREEVDVSETLARMENDRALLAPPADDVVHDFAALEAYALSGATRPDLLPPSSQMSAAAAAADADDGSDRLRPGAGHRTIHTEMREDLYLAWKDLEDRHRRSGIPGTFLSFLCSAFWQTWKDSFDSDVAYAGIYARDRFRCSSPVCPRRDITPHHLKYRSHGGTDDPDNVTSLCVYCHLEGIHAGRIKAAAPASRIRWLIGGLLEVDGRQRLAM